MVVANLLDPGNYAFSLYSIPTFVTAVSILLLGAFALKHERVSSITFSFFVLILPVSIWLLTYSCMYSAKDASTALLWAKASYLGLPFISSATYQFTVVVLRIYRQFRYAVWAIWLISALFSAVGVLTDDILGRVEHNWWGFYPRYNSTGTLFMAYFIILLIASMVHYRNQYYLERKKAGAKHERSLNLRRIRDLVMAFLVGYIGVFDFAAAYGIQVYPFGYLAIFGFVIIVSRTIWVYHFVDITPALAANQIIDTMDDALLVLDDDGVIQLTNKAASEQFGYSREEMIGAPLTARLADGAFASQLRALLSVGLTDSSHELTYNSTNGDPRILSLRASVMEGRHGYPIATVGILSDVTELRQREEALRASEARFRLMFSGNPHSMLVYDNTTLQFLEVNEAAVSLYGYTRNEFLSLKMTDICPTEDTRRLLDAISDMQNGAPFPRHWRHRTRAGEIIDVDLACQVFELGGHIATLAVAEDVTKRMRTESALENSLSLLEATLEATADGILVIHQNGKVAVFNQKFAELWQLPAELREAQDKEDEQLLAFVLDQLEDPQQFLDKVEYLYAHAEEESYDVLRFKDGRYFERYSLPCRIGGEIGGRVWSFRDVTERQTLAEQLEHQAFHDPLTGLPNRALFNERLKHALDRKRVRATREGRNSNYESAERDRGYIAVIFVDLDNFKVINDTLGHKVGDRLLVAVSERFQACLRPSDTIARLGGDEFTILLEDVRSRNEVIKVSERISQQMQAPICLDGNEKHSLYNSSHLNEHQIFVKASIGIALQTSYNDSSIDLLRRADIAMYEAKRKGEGSYVVYEPVMSAHAKKHLQLETELRRAVEEEEFRVYYQPVIDLRTGCVEGVEALVRWEHPERGLVSPLDFIPMAEHTRLIIPIGRIVIAEACRQLRQWHEHFPGGHPELQHPPLTLSVNLSAVQFRHSRLLADVSRIIEESDLDSQHIKLEITESVGMDDLSSTLETLLKLKELGVKLVLDDFGTGYSSLSYLKRFPIDALKLDRSFVEGLGQNSEDTAIVRATIAFAQALNLTVTAEGIETAAQLKKLQALGCDNGQGFFFARPMPADQISTFLAEYRPRSLNRNKIKLSPTDMARLS